MAFLLKSHLDGCQSGNTHFTFPWNNIEGNQDSESLFFLTVPFEPYLIESFIYTIVNLSIVNDPIKSIQVKST